MKRTQLFSLSIIAAATLFLSGCYTQLQTIDRYERPVTRASGYYDVPQQEYYEDNVYYEEAEEGQYVFKDYEAASWYEDNYLDNIYWKGYDDGYSDGYYNAYNSYSTNYYNPHSWYWRYQYPRRFYRGFGFHVGFAGIYYYNSGWYNPYYHYYYGYHSPYAYNYFVWGSPWGGYYWDYGYYYPYSRNYVVLNSYYTSSTSYRARNSGLHKDYRSRGLTANSRTRTTTGLYGKRSRTSGSSTLSRIRSRGTSNGGAIEKRTTRTRTSGGTVNRTRSTTRSTGGTVKRTRSTSRSSGGGTVKRTRSTSRSSGTKVKRGGSSSSSSSGSTKRRSRSGNNLSANGGDYTPGTSALSRSTRSLTTTRATTPDRTRTTNLSTRTRVNSFTRDDSRTSTIGYVNPMLPRIRTQSPDINNYSSRVGPAYTNRSAFSGFGLNNTVRSTSRTGNTQSRIKIPTSTRSTSGMVRTSTSSRRSAPVVKRSSSTSSRSSSTRKKGRGN